MSAEQETPKEEEAQAEAPAAEEAAQLGAEAAAEGSCGIDATEIEEGKTFAILSYVLNLIGLPFFIVPLIMRNNEFSLYHAKQCLVIWLVLAVLSLINVLPCIGQIIWLAVWIFMIVLNIMGINNSTKNEMKPVPVIGKWGEEWFKGLKKA